MFVFPVSRTASIDLRISFVMEECLLIVSLSWLIKMPDFCIIDYFAPAYSLLPEPRSFAALPQMRRCVGVAGDEARHVLAKSEFCIF